MNSSDEANTSEGFADVHGIMTRRGYFGSFHEGVSVQRGRTSVTPVLFRSDCAEIKTPCFAPSAPQTHLSEDLDQQ